MLDAFKRLKEILYKESELTPSKREVINFFTFGDKWDISILIYGISKEILSLIKSEFGKSLSFLIREEILTRVNSITIANSTNISDSKLIITFRKEGNLSTEERTFLVNFFSTYGDYDSLFIKKYIDHSDFIPPLIVNRIQELEAEILLLEKLAILGNIDTIFIAIPNIPQNKTTKRFSFIFIDEDENWPNALSPMDFQLHILSTVNDFTVNHFFENMSLVSNKLANTLNIDNSLLSHLLSQTSFFSLIEKEILSENSRVLSETKTEIFPHKFGDYSTKYNSNNLIVTAALFMNSRELEQIFHSYSDYILDKVGRSLFVNLCNINSSKLKSIFDKLAELENIKKEHESIIKALKKLKQISEQLKLITNKNLEENLTGNLLTLLSEMKSFQNIINNSELIAEIDKIQNQLREKLLDKKNLITSLITSLKEEENNRILERISELINKITTELTTKKEVIDLNIRILNIALNELPLIDEYISKDLLDLLRENVFSNPKEPPVSSKNISSKNKNSQQETAVSKNPELS